MQKIYEKIKDHIYVVILCGGGGTRLWPLSRKSTPKQFISLLGNETLYEKTFKRINGLLPNDHIFVITNKEYYDKVREYSPNIPEENIIAEPQKKNTAMAMGVASAYIYKRDKEAVVINLASDQLITNNSMFRETMFASAKVAFSKQHFVTVGITPTFPHTGLGYIKSGELVREMASLPVLKVDGFTEKPELKIAKQYGFQELSKPKEGTYRTFVGIDEKINRLHQYLKVLKFGYGRATDHACEDIRLGLISREKAKKLVAEYDLQPLGKGYIETICQFLDYTEKKFLTILEKYRNKEIWKKDKNGNWYIPNYLEDYYEIKT